ncbi:MAG: SDR family oxidoreductase [Anaerolineales bacterium]
MVEYTPALDQTSRILITGGTGYVGGRLTPRLLSAGQTVRVLARDPGRLRGRTWADQVQIVQGDVLQPDSLQPALENVSTAYYLVHSMLGGANFHARDIRAAENFARASAAAGVRRIVYLGGLGDPAADLSHHLRSRQKTGEALRSSGVPVIEFRAGIIVGAGSISFELIRYLAERVPVMVSPRWVFTRTQPIAIRNVLDYLQAALTFGEDDSQIIEIGGPDVLTYGEMLSGYARVRGLRRWIIPVPVLTPRLSSYWVHWVTPIPATIARPLIEGLRNEVVVRDDLARRTFPEIKLLRFEQAVQEALSNVQAGALETAWSDALSTSQGDIPPVELKSEEGMIIERRTRELDVPPHAIFSAFTSLGGERGWLYANWAWRLRGLLDRLAGGVGYRRGRRDPTTLRVGDALDFWRVEELVDDRKLVLRAEMKVPGRAWLQFEVQPAGDQQRLIQTAYFAPKGLSGLLYWYLLYPVHRRIFSGLIGRLSELARSIGSRQGSAAKKEPDS